MGSVSFSEGIGALWHKSRIWVSVAILAGLGIWLGVKYKAQADSRVAGGTYYYDTESGGLFSAPGGQIVPIKAPGGKETGVRAYVYSCTSCQQKDERFIGWLEMYDPAVVKDLQETKAKDQPVSMLITLIQEERPEGLLVADSQKPDQWISIQSKDGMKLVNKAKDKCFPEVPKLCQP